jgi:DNA-binding GntR family transcriptional regulator
MTRRRVVRHDVDMPRRLELPSVRVERELRALADRLDPGEQLPPLAKLAADLPGAGASGHTSKRTVQQVIKKLVDEGVLVTRHRWGTFKA